MNKIGLYTESIYLKNENNLSSNDIFILFFRKLFPDREINLIGRTTSCSTNNGFTLKRNEKLTELSYYKSINSLLMLLPFYLLNNLKAIFRFVKTNSILFVATPSPLSIILLKLFLLKKKRVVIFVRQDTRELIKLRHGGFLSKIVTNFLESTVEKTVKNNPSIIVLAFGRQIEKRYRLFSSNVYAIADTRYSKNDIISIDDIRSINWRKVINLIYVGRLEHGKGIENLLETVYNLKRLAPEKFHLTIIGDGTYKNHLINLCDQLDISKEVKFRGFVPFGKELLSSLRQHDIFILPSLSEGLPQVILEAMACGILTIATNAGSITQVIQNEINGYIYDKNEPRQLDNLLTKLQKENYNNTNMCRMGIKTAYSYASEIQINKLLKLNLTSKAL